MLHKHAQNSDRGQAIITPRSRPSFDFDVWPWAWQYIQLLISKSNQLVISCFVWLQALVAFGLKLPWLHEPVHGQVGASRTYCYPGLATFIIPFSGLLSSNISRGSCFSSASVEHTSRTKCLNCFSEIFPGKWKVKKRLRQFFSPKNDSIYNLWPPEKTEIH